MNWQSLSFSFVGNGATQRIQIVTDAESLATRTVVVR